MKTQFLNRVLMLSGIVLMMLSCKKEAITLPASVQNTNETTAFSSEAARPGPVMNVPIKMSLTANVYTNGTWSKSADIDKDGINDFTFTIGVSRTSTYYQVATYIETLAPGGGVLSSWQPTMLSGLPSAWVTYPLSDNVDIGAKDQTYASPSLPSTYYYSFDFFARKGGTIIGLGNKVLGMRFVTGGQTHYGCLKINITPNGRVFTIVSAAYNSTPGIPFKVRGIE